jgi:hypothetical protein
LILLAVDALVHRDQTGDSMFNVGPIEIITIILIVVFLRALVRGLRGG